MPAVRECSVGIFAKQARKGQGTHSGGEKKLMMREKGMMKGIEKDEGG
jgi:hypothetical protein